MKLLKKLQLYFTSLLCLLITACSVETPPPLRIGTNIWPGYEPLYLARKLEKWPQQTIHLVEYPSATEVLRAFRNRAIEAASLTLDEVLLLRQDNIPVTVVLVHDISAGGDVIMAKPEIKTVSALKGRRIAVESNALGAFVLTRALEINKMDLSDIEIKNADIYTHESLYNENKVDAVVTFEPIRTKLLNKGANEIFSSKQMPNEIVDVLVVHNDYLKENPGQVRLLIKGWFSAINHLKVSPDNSAAIMSKRLKISPKEVLAGYEGLHIPDLNENHLLLDAQQPRLGNTAMKLQRVLARHKLINTTIVIDSLFSNSYLPPK